MVRHKPVPLTGVWKGYVGRRGSTGWSACYGSIWNRRPRNHGPQGTILRYRSISTASKSVGYWLTVTETSAGGGIRSVTSVIFFEWMEMRFVQSENMPFE